MLILALVIAELLAAAGLWVLTSPHPPEEMVAPATARLAWTEEYVREWAEANSLGWQPYLLWRHRPYRGRYVNFDENGLRRTWSPPGGGDMSREILFLGGSTVLGRGARDDFTIPSQVAKILADDAGSSLRSINAGEVAYVSTQELLALTLMLREGTIPDVVIFYDGVNDVYSAYQVGTAGQPQNASLTRTRYESLSRSAMEGLTRRLPSLRLVERLVHGDTRRAAGNGLSAPAVDRVAPLAREIVGTYYGNVLVAKRLGRAFGFTPVFFWQPVIFSKEPRSSFEAGITATEAPMEPLYREVYAQIRTHPALSADPSFVDLSGVFEGNRQDIFIDFCHVTEKGNAIVAAAMMPAVRRALGEPTAHAAFE